LKHLEQDAKGLNECTRKNLDLFGMSNSNATVKTMIQIILISTPSKDILVRIPFQFFIFSSLSLIIADDKIIPSEVCPEDTDCPSDCYCEGGTVDCAHRDLKEFPLDLPKTAKRLLLNDNKISRVPALGLFNRLPQLESLDLSRNRIEVIEEGAFEGANSILEM